MDSLCRWHLCLLQIIMHVMGQQKSPGEDRGQLHNSLLTTNAFVFYKNALLLLQQILSCIPPTHPLYSDPRLYGFSDLKACNEASPVFPQVRWGQKGEEMTVWQVLQVLKSKLWEHLFNMFNHYAFKYCMCPDRYNLIPDKVLSK